MKILNIVGGELNMQNVMIDNYLDRMPCWYANFEFDGKDREEARWVIGIKNGETNIECVMQANKAGDVENEEFWRFITSAECAIELLKIFKDGGEKSVAKWMKNGCPH